MSGSVSPSDLHELLGRWAAERLISSEQAERIEGAEASRAEAARPEAARAQRAPLVVEALGYVGGVLALVAGVLAVGTLWRDIPAWAELTFTAAATAALAAGGALVHPAGNPAFGRLRSALWLMATVGVSGFTGILTARVLGFSPIPSVVTAFAVATVAAAVAWRLTRSAVQELALFASAASLTGTALAWATDTSSPWPSGLGLWVLSALWAVAVTRGYLGSRGTGFIAAGAGLLIGAQLTMDMAAGHVLALATVAGLLTAGVLLRRVLLVALGAAGVLAVIPQTASRYLPSSASAPLSIFVIALVILLCALWLARRSQRARHGSGQ